MVSPFDSGRQALFSRPSAKSDGGAQRQQPDLELPADAVGLELVDQVEHDQIVAKLFAGGGLVEIGPRRPRPNGK